MRQEWVTLLHGGGHSLVVAKGEEVRTFDGRGIADLYALLCQEPAELAGVAVADKVVGKGAAALLVLGGVAEVYAAVISEPALALLREYGTSVTFGQRVPYISNRTQTGWCPVERLCKDCLTPQDCLEAIRCFFASLGKTEPSKQQKL